MRHYNETSYQTLPRAGSGHRSRSQNHYYIQANEFEKRYQNSLMNSYRLNSSRKCPPCCAGEEERGYESNMTFREYEKENMQKNVSGYEMENEYYETSYFNNQKSNPNKNQSVDNETLIANFQKSKQYLQQLIQKSKTNFRVHKQKTQHQIQTIQKLLHSKNDQIQQLTKEISRLKKISLETSPNSGMNMSYMKQDQGNLVEIQNKEKQIKELQRKCARYREENSYFRGDIEIKNKEIQQLKAKFKLKEGNDLGVKKQLQKQNEQLKYQKRVLIEKIMWFQKGTQDKEREQQRDRQLRQRDINKFKRIESQLESIKIMYVEAKSQTQKIQSQYFNQIKSFQAHFRTFKQRSRQKDMQIEGLISKINCIQAQQFFVLLFFRLDFFKDKFTNLLFEIERQQRQSAVMYQHANSLKEEGVKFYEATSRIRQSELIELESQPKTSRLYGFNMLEGADHRLTESIRYNRGVGLGKESVFQSLSPKHFNKEFGLMAQSGVDFIHKFPSLNMSISPIRTKE